MFPMIATLSELRDVKAMLAEEAASLGVPPVPAGIMVEVPAAAVMAAQFAREADFFSDRHQRSHAVHAGDGPRASQARAAGGRLEPRRAAADRAHGQGRRAPGKMVGVCGGIASDPRAVPILVGLGVTNSA